MTFIRRNVWELGGDWADEVLWYAREVAAMKARALAKPTSWRFYAGMRGFSSARWQELGYLFPTDQPPSQAQLSTFWRQCQHGSSYFLPWHRGYVFALEPNIRAELVALNGPDDWALPCWNYFAPNEALPPASPRRTGRTAWATTRCSSSSDTAPTATATCSCRPTWSTSTRWVTRTLGSPAEEAPGSVGSTRASRTAALCTVGSRPAARLGARPRGRPGRAATGDGGRYCGPEDGGPRPIFWLHHANIDRLWASWNADPAHLDRPSRRGSRDRPASASARFCAPTPDGTTFTYTPGEMMNLEDLGYEYDDLTPR
jgi:tyrosinase